MLKRLGFLKRMTLAFDVHPVVGLLGPRQCGKTTLAKAYTKQITNDEIAAENYFDLENPNDIARLENPQLTLSELSGLIVIDEIQLRPDLFPILRVLVDYDRQHNNHRRFLILGSASRELLRQSSETLAGRIQYVECTPFSLYEQIDHTTYQLRGGFPLSYLADSVEASLAWRKAYITTYLERDIPNLGLNLPARTLRRFWMMLLHYHGQTFNAAEIGKSLGISGTTTRRYLDILTGTFMIRELSPWLANIKKRQVKAPKIYFRDPGIFNTLANIYDQTQLLTYPGLGSIWEGVALEEIIRLYNIAPEACFYWGVHNQAELDLLLIIQGKKWGFEFKYTDKPKLTKSMQQAFTLLALDQLFVISPGNHNFPLTEQIRAMGLGPFLKEKATQQAL